MNNELIAMDEKINNALEIAFRYGQIDGEHHKTWVIDQMVRALLGDIGRYAQWIKDYEYDEETGDEYDWDCGIAP